MCRTFRISFEFSVNWLFFFWNVTLKAWKKWSPIFWGKFSHTVLLQKGLKWPPKKHLKTLWNKISPCFTGNYLSQILLSYTIFTCKLHIREKCSSQIMYHHTLGELNQVILWSAMLDFCLADRHPKKKESQSTFWFRGCIFCHDTPKSN